jgi:prepilin peptidase CpaA
MFSMPTILKFVLLAIVLVAGTYDCRFRKIPNWINLSGVVLGLGVNTLLSEGHGLATAILGLLCSLAIYVPLYLVRGMGAGDVKLMAAVGAIAGPSNWVGIFIATALAGGVLAVIVIAVKKRWLHTLSNLAIIVPELFKFRAPSSSDSRLDIRNADALRLPHAVSIALGSVAFLSFVAFA